MSLLPPSPGHLGAASLRQTPALHWLMKLAAYMRSAPRACSERISGSAAPTLDHRRPSAASELEHLAAGTADGPRWPTSGAGFWEKIGS